MPFHLSPPPRELNTIILPMRRHGSFFHDAAFDVMRKSFEEAMKDVITNRWNKGHLLASDNLNSFHDLVSTYRQLRSHDVTEESQAVKVVQEDDHYKVKKIMFLKIIIIN